MSNSAPHGYGLRVGGYSSILHVLEAGWVTAQTSQDEVTYAMAVCGAGLGIKAEFGSGRVCEMCTNTVARELRATRWA